MSAPAAWNALSLFSRAAVFLLQHLLVTSLKQLPREGTSVPGQTPTANCSFLLHGTREGATDTGTVTKSSKILGPFELPIPTETPYFLKQEAKKERKTNAKSPQDICIDTHFGGCPKPLLPGDAVTSEDPRQVCTDHTVTLLLTPTLCSLRFPKMKM